VLVEFFVLHRGFLSPKILPLPTQIPDGPVFLNDSRFKHHFNLIWQIDRFHGSEDPIFEDCMDRF
jgi:hypothetical protein